jgi:hypothetical protein
MSVLNTFADFGRANAQGRAEQVKTKNAKRQRQEAMAMLRNQQRDPYLASKSIPTYQRSESPIADAFLESLLTGSNPQAVQGTRAGSATARAGAQRTFDANTGGMDALRARQEAMQTDTPWRLNRQKPPSQTRTPARLQFDLDENYVRDVMSSDANRDLHRTTRRY